MYFTIQSLSNSLIYKAYIRKNAWVQTGIDQVYARILTEMLSTMVSRQTLIKNVHTTQENARVMTSLYPVLDWLFYILKCLLT